LTDYQFRGLFPNVRFGTASDRYAGWIGQIYPPEYSKRITARSKDMGGRRFREETVPIDSTKHYFEHFDVLEVDYTFYSPLLEPDGGPSRTHLTLEQYADHAPAHARFILKAPQVYSARILRRGPGYVENPEYLDFESYTENFLRPAADILGERLDGVLFEQEYGRERDSPRPEEFAAELDDFFGALPDGGPPTHLEIRSPHLHAQPFYDMLDRRGLGHAISHWTWLPPIRKQIGMAGGFHPAGPDRDVLIRLLTPLNVRYADAYAMAHPFDRVVPELADTPGARAMISDTARAAIRAATENIRITVLANNRAWGNAPSLTRAVVDAMQEGGLGH
jgi:uncharacterized protein YecE (DUF72 family)